MKILSLFKKYKANQRGDTIIEVLISVAILALVLGTAYAVSNHSLRTGTAAGQRNQALGYAQSQIEFIKEAQATALFNDKLDQYQNNPSSDFCIDINGSHIGPIPESVPQEDFNIYKGCLSYNNDTFTVRVQYNDLLRVFTINVWWAGANLTSQDSHLVLFYKLPGGFLLKPIVTMEPALPVSKNAMTLHGTVNPNGDGILPNSCKFKWYADPARTTLLGDKACVPFSVGSGNSPVSVSADITGLTAGTTYYTKLCAANSAGESCADGQQQTDPPGAPADEVCGNGDEDGDGVTDEGCGGGGGCSGQGGDGTYINGPDPCVWYLRASRPGGNTVRFEFRADHCTTSISLSYGGGSVGGISTRDSNGADPEVADGNDPNAGSATLTCIGKDGHYWSSASTSYDAGSGGSGCDNGAINPPACDNFGGSGCVNGAINPPQCDNWGGGDTYETRVVCKFPDGSWSNYESYCESEGGISAHACFKNGGFDYWGKCP